MNQELKQKCDNLALLIKTGFAPKGQAYYDRLWADFARDARIKARSLRALEKLRREKNG